MNSKTTCTLIALALGLFAFIYFFERHLRHNADASKPARLLPQLNLAAVTSIQVKPAGESEIRAERTNDVWMLTKPLVNPAQGPFIQALLNTLQKLSGQNHITPEELKNRPQADKEFGFDNPQVSLVFWQGNYRGQVLIGTNTAFHDEIFLKVVGIEGLYVVDSKLLRLIPRTANDWRDPALVNLKNFSFDRIIVTNMSKVFELQREGANKPWRMTQPMKARADNTKIEELLRRLQTARVNQFVSDDPKADLESFGLQPPQLALALAQGTNNLLALQFGKSPTNAPTQVFVRRPEQNSIVLIPGETIESWRGSFNDFRDRRLISADIAAVQAIEVRGKEQFSALRQPIGLWRVDPDNLTADSGAIRELIGDLTSMGIAQFTADVATDLDFPTHGLAPPAWQYILRGASLPGGTNATVTATNIVLAEIHFGSTNEDKVFARRPDENSIYAVKLSDVQWLPTAGWQLRDRRIWDFSEKDVVSVTVRQNGRTRQLLRSGTNQWSIAPGSQGIINSFGVEETVHRLGALNAAAWVARGQEGRAQFGFSEKSLRIAIELKRENKTETVTVEFNDHPESEVSHASVDLDGQPWIFACPRTIFEPVQLYLSLRVTP